MLKHTYTLSSVREDEDDGEEQCQLPGGEPWRSPSRSMNDACGFCKTPSHAKESVRSEQIASCKVGTLICNDLLRMLHYPGRSARGNGAVRASYVLHVNLVLVSPDPYSNYSRGLPATLGANPSPSMFTEAIGQHSICALSVLPAQHLHPPSPFGASMSYLQWH